MSSILRSRFRSAPVLAALVILLLRLAGLCAELREAQWREVKEHLEKSLPQSVIAVLEKIEPGALADKAWPEVAKAVGLRLTMQGEIAEDGAEKITRMNAELEKAPAELRPMLHTVQALWLAEYHDAHRWELASRSSAGAAEGDDMKTWSLQRLQAEVHAHFQKALEAAPLLQKVLVAEWSTLLEPGGLPDSYEPTLYDFVARTALEFYAGAEQAYSFAGPQGADAADAFSITADSPALAPLAEFLAWKLPPEAADSAQGRMMLLSQDVLRFHKDDADSGARVLADLRRISRAAEAAGTEAARRKKTALVQALLVKNSEHEVSLCAALELAEALRRDDKPVEALALIKPVAEKFQASAFSPRSRNLISTITARSLSIGTESIWNAAGPDIRVTSRNVPKVFFRLYAMERAPKPLQIMKADLHEEKLVKGLLQQPPTRAWSADLPDAATLLKKEHVLQGPGDLEPRIYLLAAGGREDFAAEDNDISATLVLATPLAVVATQVPGAVEVLVVDAVSGEPVKGAEVTLTSEVEDEWKTSTAVRTGADGYARLPAEGDNILIHAQHQGRVGVAQGTGIHGDEPDKPDPSATVFFTDRAIYRPGQIIQFKGIHYHADQKKNDYRVLPGVTRTVLLQQGEKELGKITVTTNEFGSFSGTFTAPRTGLTGTLRITDPNHGSAEIRVEEYKRPKFKVELQPQSDAFRIGDEAKVTLNAKAFTGAPVGGALVKWRISRQRQADDWWRTFRHPGSTDLASGEGRTQADGTLEIRFTAAPDKSDDPSAESWYEFSVHADVTDTAGETRSAESSLQAGYVGLKAQMEAEPWQTTAAPVRIKASVTSPGGIGQKATGTITIHHLKYPDKVQRPGLTGGDFDSLNAPGADDPETWETGEVVQREALATDEKGEAEVAVKLPAGAFRAVLETRDAAGKKVTAKLGLVVSDPAAAQFPVPVPFWLSAEKLELQPGESLNALWGSGYAKARAFVQIEHRGKVLERFWTEAGRTQQRIQFEVGEEHRGGFTVKVIQVRENRVVQEQFKVDVPWTTRKLALKWEHLTSQLAPGKEESWTLSIAGPDKELRAAEFAATLYDASLDEFTRHSWPVFNPFYRESPVSRPCESNRMGSLSSVTNAWEFRKEHEYESGRSLPRFLGSENPIVRGLRFGRDAISAHAIDALIASTGLGGMPGEMYGYAAVSPPAPTAGDAMLDSVDFGIARKPKSLARTSVATEDAAGTELALDRVSARRNLQETAFFYPHLTTASDGTVKLTFTMPEALTAWKFLGFAHDKELRSGTLGGDAVTSRDLMVQPNPPRFLREGDAVDFTVRLTNTGSAPQAGKARLTFSDAATLQSADAAMGNASPEQDFEVPAKESRTLSWRVTVPDGQGFLIWKAVAATDTLSDGEEAMLPVLPRRILVTESLPLPVRGAGTKQFDFKKLSASGASGTLQHKSLTVQVVSQPAWYALLALPMLMEFPHECSEQTFSRLYANALAAHVAQSDPKIRRVFDLWRDAQPGALESPLLKNEDLKQVMIEETPWLRDAADESEQRRNIGLLFDQNRLDSETARLLQRLGDSQLPDGLWPWFPGGPGNHFISLYIFSGFGRLQHLGVELPDELALNAADSLDEWLETRHREILKEPKTKDENHLDSDIALYLYGRSFFAEKRPVQQKEALEYFLGQARRHWTTLPRMSQAHAALGLLRFGDKETPKAILKSIREHAVQKEELGMYWPEKETWWWHRAPVETQAMMIELLREVARDTEAVDACQLWLLKQKQTQAWPTTKATADAVYALLLGGSSLLASDALVRVSLGGKEVQPENVEAGTGFYEQRYGTAEIVPEMGKVTLTKKDEGAAWGSVHWQYLEDVTKVTPPEGGPLQVTKALFTRDAKSGQLVPVQGSVKAGDELVVRLTIRADRAMEFIHLKDQRPASVEPVNVLSGYKWQDGLGYYESTRDAASHFFFDSLPQGTHVFEYSSRVQLRGTCQTGVAVLQCMYAPEFSARSASTVLQVE